MVGVNELLIPLLLSLVAAGGSVAVTWRILASVIGSLTNNLNTTIDQRNSAELARIKEIEAQVALKNEMADMARQMLKQQNDQAEQKAQLIELQADSAARLETIRRLQERAESDQLERDDLLKQIRTLQAENARLRNFEKRIDALENQVDSLTAERNDLVKERDDLKVRLEKAEKAENELRDRVATLEKANETKASEPPQIIEGPFKAETLPPEGAA